MSRDDARPQARGGRDQRSEGSARTMAQRRARLQKGCAARRAPPYQRARERILTRARPARPPAGGGRAHLDQGATGPPPGGGRAHASAGRAGGGGATAAPSSGAASPVHGTVRVHRAAWMRKTPAPSGGGCPVGASLAGRAALERQELDTLGVTVGGCGSRSPKKNPLSLDRD